MSQERPPVVVNGVKYRWPERPVVVVIIDGGDPAYIQQFLHEGAIPNVARFMQEGFAVVADGTVPSFTCPNNMSIVTGTPASANLVMMVSPRSRSGPVITTAWPVFTSR